MSTIRVNFGKPFPVFVLPSVVLLPHALIRLFIFEDRYRQMIGDILDSAGQIAMAIAAEPERDPGALECGREPGDPPIHPAVCIGQIAKHHQMPDGTYHIWLHGVCRAEVVEEQLPEGERLYRTATLRPLGSDEEEGDEEEASREEIVALLRSKPLGDLDVVQKVLSELADRDEVPLSALVELVTLSVLSSVGENRVPYRVLAEPELSERVELVTEELTRLATVVRVASCQFDPDAPHGVSWN
ncbi:MAG: LON peptidase substrate-binding domain-containing protein [Phycisphaerales bacterium]